MKLSTNSWHSKLHEYMYAGDLPKSLCPYFWKLVIGVLLVIPVTIIYLPFFLFYSPKKFDGLIHWRLAVGIGTANAICVLVCGILWLIGIRTYLTEIFALIALLAIGIFTVIMTITGIGILVEKIPSKRKPRKPKLRKDPKPNLLLEFIKAKYERYCPKIYWMSEERRVA